MRADESRVEKGKSMSIDEMKRLRRALARCALVIAREADTMRELSLTIDGKCYLDHEVDFACATLGCSRNELEELSKAEGQ